MTVSIDEQAEQLVQTLRKYESCVVAFSGGVDSAVVARAAYAALGDRSVAIVGIGPAVSDNELQHARRTAAEIGISQLELPTSEMDRAAYVANAPDRCFHCKTELYSVLGDYARSHNYATVANGTVVDDLGDYRPGLVAASDAGVRTPLIDCKLDKTAVRQLAHHWGLEIWDKPASPCLASRIAYGQEVTGARLRMVDAAEQLLRQMGICECRVRYHAGDLARIEVPIGELQSFADPELRDWLLKEFRNFGFKYVTLDLAGFRSGSMNVGLPILQ